MAHTDDSPTPAGHGAVPWPVIVICATIVAIVLVMVFGGLIALGRDPTVLSNVLNTAFSGGGWIAGILSAVYAGKAARSGHIAASALNGGFDDRVTAIVEQALSDYDRGRGGPAGSGPR
jgi:hypothetical protein